MKAKFVIRTVEKNLSVGYALKCLIVNKNFPELKLVFLLICEACISHGCVRLVLIP